VGIFAYVTFGTSREMYKAVADAPHTFKGASVDVVEARPKSDRRGDAPPGEARVFVGRIPCDTRDSDLKEYFGRYGAVEDVYRPKQTPKDGTEFAFVVFKTTTDVARVLSVEKHILDGKQELNVLRARPRNQGGAGGAGGGAGGRESVRPDRGYDRRAEPSPPQRREEYGRPPSLDDHYRIRSDAVQAAVPNPYSYRPQQAQPQYPGYIDASAYRTPTAADVAYQSIASYPQAGYGSTPYPSASYSSSGSDYGAVQQSVLSAPAMQQQQHASVAPSTYYPYNPYPLAPSASYNAAPSSHQQKQRYTPY